MATQTLRPMHPEAHFVIEHMNGARSYLQLVFVDGPLDDRINRNILCWVDNSGLGLANLKFVASGCAGLHQRVLLSVPEHDFMDGRTRVWTMFTDEMKRRYPRS